MGMIGRLPSGEEVMLPHPDIPCAWCGKYVMDELACPNAHDICIDCCGEDDDEDEVCGIKDEELVPEPMPPQFVHPLRP